MSKFKNGDKIRLKAGVQGWSSSYSGVVWEFPYEDVDGISVGNLVRDWEDDFELAEENKQRHVHYDLIVEWAANPSRIVEYLDITFIDGEESWSVCAGQQPAWCPETRYRFKPDEAERTFPTTSLTDDELTTLFDVTLGGVVDALKAIANEAIKRYILEQENKESK